MIESNRSSSNGNSIWTNVTPQQPCPVCHRGDWCFISKDGRYAGCRREGRFDGQHRIDSAGCDFWLYDLSGDLGHIATPPPPSLPKDQEPPPRNEPKILNDVYRALLEKLSLSDIHKENLLKRGLTEEEIGRRGYRTWPKTGRAAIAKSLAVQFGDPVLKKTPGFYLKTDEKDSSNQYWSLAGGSGLAIPVRDENRRIIAFRIRLDDSPGGANKYIWLSSTKHNGPSPGSPLHFPGFDEDISSQETIRITEGELKSDIATVLSNVFTLSIPGVLNWRSVFDHLEKFPSLKTIRIAFDADASQNTYVADALKELALALCAKEYTIELETWDLSAGKGIDDVFNAKGYITPVTGENVGPRLDEILESAKRNNPPRHVKQIEEATRRIDFDNLAEKLDSPEFLNDRDNIDALALIQKLSPGDWLSKVKPVLRSKGILRDVEKLVKSHKIKRQTASNPSGENQSEISDSNDRPMIETNGRDLHEFTLQAINLLHEANRPPSLFLRSGEIVRILFDEKKQPVLSVADSKAIRQCLAEAGCFIRTHEMGISKVNPPMALCENILEFPSYPFPGIESIVEIPVLRPDGSIRLEAGYDPATRLYYARNDELSNITLKDSPGENDLSRAKETIIDILYDFPFVDQASFANTAALIISPFIRHAYDGCSPLVIIDAPKGGSGKSLLARIISIIATGQKAAVLCAPETEAEWRKKITSTLSSGKTIIVLDNVESTLWAPSLEAVLTTTVWEDRKLGETKNIKVAQRATWIATGNNVQLRRALPRRCYQIRLDPKTDKPEEVEGFRHSELETYVKKNRSRIVESVLTLIRSWYAAGCPAVKTKPLGGFEDWARILHGILHHAGIEGFLGNRAELYQQSDEEGPAWEGFLAEWFIVFGDRTLTVSDIVHEIEFNESFRNSLPPVLLDAFVSPKGSFRKKLGVSLSKKRDTQFGEYRLEMRGIDSHSKQRVWGVMKVDSGFAGSAGRFFHRKTQERIKKNENKQNSAGSAGSAGRYLYTNARETKNNVDSILNIDVYIEELKNLPHLPALPANQKSPNGIPAQWLEDSKSWPESTQTSFKGFINAYKDNRASFDEVERAYNQFQNSSTKESDEGERE